MRELRKGIELRRGTGDFNMKAGVEVYVEYGQFYFRLLCLIVFLDKI